MPPAGQRAAAGGASALPRWSGVLRAIREARGVSQAGWAARLGRSRNTVQRWECGRAIPDAETEQAIVDYCRAHALFELPLGGYALTSEGLRQLFAAARVSSAAMPEEQQPPEVRAPRTSGLLPSRVRATGSHRSEVRLPASPNGLIGREAELAVIRRQLLESGVRLVTLTGPAGVGKTRLALAAAEALHDAFERVRFTPLAPIADVSLVLPAIAQTLGVRDTGHKPLLENVTAFVGNQRVLLVIDNFEQVLGAGPMVADLMAACVPLTLLVTSRAALRLRWEQQIPVLPLRLPDPRRSEELAAVSAAPAVRLFVARARAARPEFALTANNAVAVAAICRRLDGLPLAIELAAARVAVLSPPRLLERLHGTYALPRPADAGPFALLSAGAPDLPERQQTLRRAIGWSYDLLSEQEQALLRHLSVFVGGCTLEAAEAVAGGACGDILNSITLLVNASLVQREESSDGEVRLSMLELIREFAVEELERTGALMNEARRCHATYYLQLAEAGRAALDGPDQAPWLERLAREYDNLRAAFAYATTAADGGELALALVSALDRYWEMRGEYREGRGWVELALARAEGADTRALARTRAQLGTLALRAGDKVTARAQCEQSLAMYRALGEGTATARMLNSLAVVALIDGDLPAARALFEECATCCRALDDGAGVAMALNNRGVLEKIAGDHDLAARCFRECVTLSRIGGHLRWLALGLVNLGWVLLALADADEASACAAEGVRLCQTHGFQLVLAHGVAVFGIAAFGWQQGVRAARLFAASTALLAATGSARVEPIPVEADRLAVELRAVLGEQAFAAAWAEGGAMTTDEAVTYALADEEHGAGAAVSAESSGAAASDPRRPAGAVVAEPAESPATRLTVRELEVVRLAAGGRTSKEIASELVLSERTVENHLFRIYTRLGARGRADAIAYAIRNGFI